MSRKRWRNDTPTAPRRMLRLAEAKPRTYLLHSLTVTLNNLGHLYLHTQRISKAEKKLKEALAIRRQLAEAKPEVFLSHVASTLTELRDIYHSMQRHSEEEEAYQEILTIELIASKR